MSWGVAMCICGEPLVSTMVFLKFEFFCVRCGRKVTYFGPIAADETPELLARIEENEAAFAVLADGAIGDGAMLTACPVCMEKHEPHTFHATPEELEANRAAVERLVAVGK